jgi:NTE family protein
MRPLALHGRVEEFPRGMSDSSDKPPISSNVPGESSPPSADRGELALVMGGGGARGAYQVGLLRYLARRYPDLRFPILTGVSAGAVNVAHLAQHTGTFSAAVTSLERLWRSLSPDQVFHVDAPRLAANFIRWGMRLASGGTVVETQTRGLVDTSPLRTYLTRALGPQHGVLTGVEQNIAHGSLRAVALSTTDYSTGQSIVWMQGRNIQEWERPKRRSIATRLTVEHVMGSSALPFFFPAVRIDDSWHGDGGIRLTAPLSPALHLGAHKILAISTRYDRSQQEANRPSIRGYPPPAQVLSILYNSIFLDLIDQDVLLLERMNFVLRKLPPEQRSGMRVVNILVLRPSRDLGKLSSEYEPLLPGFFRFLTRGLGTRQTASPDILSLIMFQANYLGRLIELGEADAEARADDIEAFLEG